VSTLVERSAPNERMLVTLLGGAPKERVCVRTEAPLHVASATVHNNSLPNVQRALRERVYCVEKEGKLTPPPAPVRDIYSRLDEYRRALLDNLGRYHPCTDEEFLGFYTGAKLKRYRSAVEWKNLMGVHRRNSFLASFVKAEFLNRDSKPDPCPRIIQPRNAVYNAAIGVYLRPLEHKIYRAIARVFGQPTVFKGYNAGETACLLRNMWDALHDPVAVGIDASRFDQHVSVPALQWEHGLYTQCFADFEERAQLAELLSWQIKNRGFVNLPEAKVEYNVDGCRMSGDMNTALGNCLIMTGVIRRYCLDLGIKPSLANNGDDCVVFMERADLDRFMAGLNQHGLDYGFTLKVEEPSFEFERIEFCQSRPVCVDGEWVMVRNPWICTSKDTCMKHPDTSRYERSYRLWLGQVGTCGLALCGGIPVLQEFYLACKREGATGVLHDSADFARTGLAWASRGMSRSAQPVSESTRYSFWLAWGVTPDMQLALEQEWRAWKIGGLRHDQNLDTILAIPITPVV